MFCFCLKSVILPLLVLIYECLGAHNVLALVITFEGFDWKPKHVILDLFEVSKTSRHALAKILTNLLNEYGLKNRIIIYVKYKGSNLNTMTIAFKFVDKCEALS